MLWRQKLRNSRTHKYQSVVLRSAASAQGEELLFREQLSLTWVCPFLSDLRQQQGTDWPCAGPSQGQADRGFRQGDRPHASGQGRGSRAKERRVDTSPTKTVHLSPNTHTIQSPVQRLLLLPPHLSLLSTFDIRATAESAKPSAMEENPPTTDKGTIFVHMMRIKISSCKTKQRSWRSHQNSWDFLR